VNSSFYSSSLIRELAGVFSELGYGVLLANNRGHDLCSVSYGPLPQRIGSQFENVSDCIHDFQAWQTYLTQKQTVPFGLAAHSLGAVKGAYWLGRKDAATQVERFLALSPPRLNTELIADGTKKGLIFAEQLERARELCSNGEGDRIIRVRFPLPTWVSASTFADKYGSGSKYDYLATLGGIEVPTLWAFGSIEVTQGMRNFRNADVAIREVADRDSMYHHRATVIDGGDHSYTGVRSLLFDEIRDWLASM
jgi:predicted alpha/beta hydrolase family esterase